MMRPNQPTMLSIICVILVCVFEFNLLFSQELPRYAPGSLVIKFSLSAKESGLNPRVEQKTIKTSIGSVDLLNEKFNASSFTPFYFEPYSLPEDIALGKDRMYVFQFPAFTDMDFIANEYSKDSNVEYAHPNWLYDLLDEPNDPDYQNSNQWALDTIKASGAWDITHGSNAVKIGILDTGVDLDHPDISGNLATSSDWRDEVDINTATYTAQGYQLLGYEDYTTPDTSPQDHHSHGTHVAGIVSAATNNNTGIAGLGWNCKIIPLRVGAKIITPLGDTSAVLESDDWARALDWARNNTSVDVINMSFGGTTAVNESNIISAYNAGITLVAAMGNDGNSTRLYPAGFENYVIAVGATNESDQRASFSNYGSWIDLTAPGTNIKSTLFDNTYGNLSGTSMAAPHVAGLAALLIAKYSDAIMTPSKVEQVLEYNAKDLGSSGFDNYYGYGRIDAEKTLKNIIVPIHYSLIDYALYVAISGQTVIVESGTHRPESNTIVGSGVTLEVKPNATVKMPNDLYISVYGKMTASNTSFILDGSSGSWQGIRFENGSQASSLINCTIKTAQKGVYDLNSQANNISYTNFDSCGYGIYAIGSGNPSYNNGRFRWCTQDAIRLEGADAIMYNIKIQNNFDDGFWFTSSCDPDIWTSLAENNSGYGVYCYNYSTPDFISAYERFASTIRNNGNTEVYSYNATPNWGIQILTAMRQH